MIEQIVAFILQFWRTLVPWAILNREEVGFIRRLGQPVRDMSAGWNWKVPMLETAEVEDGREYPVVLDPQSLRTKDGVEVVIRAIATCHVFDARRYFLEAADGRTNVQDLVGGELGWLVQRRNSADVLGGRVLTDLTARSCKAARKWGIHIETVKFLDAVAAPSFRLWQNQITSSGQE